MNRLVQKFGGTSVRDTEHIQRVAKIIADASRKAKEVVVVVSAMGHCTDELLALASQIDETPDARELDVLLATGEQVSTALLAMALQKQGVKARSFSGPQAGILTDDTHGFAKIKTVHPSRIENSLRRGEIPIVAGFQGMTRSSELTTLGRGGSDTTAVALAAALKAECCDIYTDVDGVYTTDPRTVANARRLSVISYEEMLALASAGAQVLNARSVELAMKNKVPIRLRSTFAAADTGTLVTARELAPENQICGVACDSSHVTMRFVIARDFTAEHDESKTLSDEVKIQAIIHELQSFGLAEDAIKSKKANGVNISELEFACEKRISREVQSFILDRSIAFPGSELKIDAGVARVSLVGYAIHEEKEYKSQFLSVLEEENIPVSMLIADPLSLSAVLPSEMKDEAVRSVHKKFCTGNLSDTLALVN